MANNSPGVISSHLYRNILRSMLNAVPDKRVGCQLNNLIDHVRLVFSMPDNKHAECLSREEGNRPGLDLHLIIFEAKNLANASRPFCTINLHRNRVAPFLNPRRESNFQRGKVEEPKDIVVKTDTLTTSCAFESIHPKWEEEFRLFSTDHRQEHVHINIYSADMKSSPSSEPGKRSPRLLSWTRNQISSKLHLRNSNSEPNLSHDVIGQCIINLKTIPHTTWKDTWMPVQSRRKTSGGLPAGEMHIRARLFPHQVQSQEMDDPESEFVSIDDYILVMRQFHEYSARSARINHLLYNGDVYAADVKNEVILEQFAAANNISWQCSCILSLGILLQWKTEGMTLDESALPNALECLETALSVMGSSLDVCEESFPRYAENRFFWSSSVCFARYQVEEATRCIRLFPPQRLDYLTGMDKSIQFLKKLVHLSLFRDMKADLGAVVAESVENRIKENVSLWAENNMKCQLIHPEDMDKEPRVALTDNLADLNSMLTRFGRVVGRYYHERFGINYIEVIFTQLSDHIYEAVARCISQILSYQKSNIRRPAAVTHGSKLSMQLYHVIKEFIDFCSLQISETSVQSTCLSGYKLMFHECVVYWLKTWQSASSDMVLRSVKIDLALERVDPNMNVAESAVLALNVLVSGVLDDWNNLQIEDTNTMLVGVTKITSIFCDGVVEYSRFMHKLLLKDDEQYNLQKGKIMTVANSVMYLGDYLEEKLPGLLMFQRLFQALRLQDAESIDSENMPSEVASSEIQIQDVLMKMIKSSKQTVYEISHELTRIVVRKMMPDLKSKMISRIFGETKTSTTLLWKIKKMMVSPSQVHEITFMLARMLQAVKDNVREPLFLVAMDEFWTISLAIMKAHIAPGQGQEYYQEALAFVLSFHEFIQTTSGVSMKTYHRVELNSIVERLKLQALETKELLLRYFGKLADNVYCTNMDETTPWIDVQAGHMKLTNDSIYLLINIVEAGNLPELDSNGLCDPFVVLDLQPKTLFPEDSRRETPAIPRTLHPVYNQIFEFQIPTEAFLTHGAVLFLTVWDFDHVKLNDLAGESTIHLAKIPHIKQEDDLRQLPTVRLPLVLPGYDHNEIIEVLRLRTRYDKTARKFYHQRLRTILRIGMDGPFAIGSNSTGHHIAAMIERVANMLSIQSYKINLD